MANAGDTWEEVIHVDNGSIESVANEVYELLEPDVTILNKENLGVAKGYNRGLGLATKDYIVITGCDMLMPDNWLKTFKDYVTAIPNTGVACIYSKPLDECKSRARKSVDGEWSYDTVCHMPIAHAMPIERRIFRRALLSEFGYFPEDFGLYSWDDVAWAHRAEMICDRLDLLYYVIPGMTAVHLGTEGVEIADGKDEPAYHQMKKNEAEDEQKIFTLNRRRKQNWPKFTPYL